MKIMYVNTLGVWGGVATYLKPLISHQVEQGNSVCLVVGNEGELTDYISNNIPEVEIIVLETMKRNVDVLGIIKSILKFRKIVIDYKPDIVHYNCIMAGLIGRIGSIFLPSKSIYNAHGWAFEPGTDKKFRTPAIIIEKILALFTDNIICVSDYEKSIADKYHVFKNTNQSVVIKNASDDFSKLKISEKDENDKNVFKVTMSARFWEQKNQLLLIKGFERFISKHDDKSKFKLFLLGDGPKLAECLSYVKNHQMSDIVEFTGMVNNVYEYYYHSDVVALITNYDAIAISLIEALSMSKPLIASDTCGVPENFSKDSLNGYCIDNDINDISNALNSMYLNPKLRKTMGENSRELYEKNFKMERNIELHDNLYKSLVEK